MNPLLFQKPENRENPKQLIPIQKNQVRPEEITRIKETADPEIKIQGNRETVRVADDKSRLTTGFKVKLVLRTSKHGLISGRLIKTV